MTDGIAVGLAIGVGVLLSLSARPDPQSTGAPVAGYKIVRAYPHDSRAFTQGLIFRDGFLYESTGLNGRSSLRKVALETGDVVAQYAVGAKYFAEGLTEWDGKLLQLTWQTHVGFVYDMSPFKMVRTFEYTGEGWGLTHDRTRLILSDGTAVLRFLNPETFAEVGHITVTDAGKPVTQLNELEFVKGEILANVWYTDRIARISPVTGHVIGWIDLSGLKPGGTSADAVLNGIAYDAAGDRLFVTGKLWPQLFEITVGK
jgi:glutamine cyclotransferase